MSQEQEYQGSMEQFDNGPEVNKPLESEQTKTVLEKINEQQDLNLAPQQQAVQNQFIQQEVNQPNIQLEQQAPRLQQISNAQFAEFQDMQNQQMQQQQAQPQLQNQIQQQPQKQQLNQQQPQQQKQQVNKKVQNPNTSSGFYDKIKKYVGDIFSSDTSSQYQFIPTNNYNDDDDLLNQIEQYKQSQYNLEENIDLQVKAQYKMGTLKKDTTQLLPATISFTSKDIQIQENAKEMPSIGIDLICVIDVSGSMQGTKLDNVKKTLLILLDFLRDQDRLCLITFEYSGQRMTPLKGVNASNKKYFRNAIHTLNARGGTNIGSGTDLALKQMKERNSKNKVTSIFLLSDGQDSQAVKTITQQIANVQEVFSINTFGFGDDHDAKMMSALSEIGKGSFYFIKDVSLLDEFFADALGGLVSAIGENLEIHIKCAPKKPFDNIIIEKTFGDMWTQIDKNRYYTITLPQIAAGAKKDYVFEINLPKFEGQIQDQERQVVVVDAICTLQGTSSAQKVTKHAQLELTLFNENEPIPTNEQDLDVAAQHLRVKATDAIDDARRACEQNKNEDAEQMLQQMKIQIEQGDEKLKVVAKETLINLEQASKACQKQNFAKHGSKQMTQMKVNNYNQRGLNAQFDDLGQQMQQVEQGEFCNHMQTTYLKSVQKRKQ